MPRTIREEAYEVVKELPGSTSADVVALMPHVKKQSIYSVLDVMRSRGEIRQARPAEGGHVKWYVNETVTPPMPKRRKKTAVIEVHGVTSAEQAKAQASARYDLIKPRNPYAAEFEKHLTAKITELEAWKADAIQRYPDLAIPPLLKKARDIVAQELRESGDVDLAEKAIAGQLDTKLPVRLVLKMLEGEVV